MEVSATQRIPFSPKYHENMERCNTAKGDPCIVCGKLVQTDRQRYWVAVDIERNEFLSAEEAEKRPGGDRKSYYVVGSNCAKLPEVEPYVSKG
jgi:hypothetical protein